MKIAIELSEADALQLLGDLMSAHSEEYYSAGWHDGCEDKIPEWAAKNRATDATAALMCALAEGLGYWANYNGWAAPEYAPYSPKKEDAK